MRAYGLAALGERGCQVGGDRKVVFRKTVANPHRSQDLVSDQRGDVRRGSRGGTPTVAHPEGQRPILATKSCDDDERLILRPPERVAVSAFLGVKADDVQIVAHAQVEVEGFGSARRRFEDVQTVVEFLPPDSLRVGLIRGVVLRNLKALAGNGTY